MWKNNAHNHSTQWTRRNHVHHRKFFSQSWGCIWPSVCTTLVLTKKKKIPSLFAVFVSPTLAFGTPKSKGDGRTSTKWRNITDVCLHELLPLFSLPAQSGLLSFFSPPLLFLHKTQTTFSNVISVATCKGLLRRLPVKTVWADTVQTQATPEPRWLVFHT